MCCLNFYKNSILAFIFTLKKTIKNILPQLKDSVNAIYKRSAIYKISVKIVLVYILVKRVDALIFVCQNTNVI